MTQKILQIIQITILFLVLGVTQMYAEVEYAKNLQIKEVQVGNLLEWSTALEKESAFFYVEKSLDGITFEQVGEVAAAGYSEAYRAYRYMDIQVTDMDVQYRLRQVDVDGTESFSETVRLIKNMTNQFLINYSSDIMVETTFQVVVEALSESTMQYALSTYQGEPIFATSKKMQVGINDFEINMEGEKAGKYRLVFQLNDEIETLYFIKTDDKEQKQNVANQGTPTRG